MKAKKGSVLMITLWITAILALFTFGLAHRATLNLKIVRNQRNVLRAYYLAKAGIQKTIMLAQEDALDSTTKDYDTVLECGVNLKDKDPKEIFSENSPNSEEGFRVGFYNANAEFVYGASDEESKINLASPNLATLFEQNKIEGGSELAQTIQSWIASESLLDNLGSAEIPKKEPLAIPEELTLILEYFFSTKNILDAKEKASQEYEKFKDSVTIYGDGKINVNTANLETLEILAKTYSLQNNLRIDAYAIAQKIIELRDNPQRKFYKTIAELQTDIQADPNLDVEQKGFFNSFLLPFLKCSSDYLKIHSTGFVGSTTKQITVVYDRLLKKAAYWHEN
jgi:hypothetical protein